MTQSEFWKFSLSLYALPGVADHCLSLQNDHGLDVNLVLFCIWYGRQFGTLPEALLDDALLVSAQWRELVVSPLRTVRTEMKKNVAAAELFADSGYTELREAIKRIELQAERIQQEKLAAMASAYTTDAVSTAQAEEETNLHALCTRLGVEPSQLHQQATAIISASRQL